MERDLKLGHPYRDSLSGLVGRLTSRHDMLDGATQYGIQPFSEDGKEVKEGKVLDWHTLVAIEDASIPPVTCIDSFKDGIELGDTVCDIIQPRNQGVVVERSTFLNGCVYYNVILQSWLHIPQDTVEPRMFRSATRLRVVKRASETAPEDVLPTPGKGGPMRAMQSPR